MMRAWWCMALAVLASSPVGSAAVIGVDARVTSSVQEFIDGEEASFAADEAETGPELALPILANTQLSSTDLVGALVGEARSFAELSDPTLLDQPNPAEFAVEAACYANGPSVSYSVRAAADEARQVIFVQTPQEGIPREIDFGPDGTAVVESQVFLGGAIVLWATRAGVDLDAVAAEVVFSISQDDESANLFEASVAVAGGAAAGGVGPLRISELDVDDLTARGLDPVSAEGLRNVAEAGALRIMAIPTQSHPYSYTVRAGEAFVLTARMEILLRNAPGGTGAAVVLGRPFSELAGFIGTAIEGIDGSSFEESLNQAVASEAVDLSVRRPFGLCGTLGPEFALFGIPFAGLFARRRHGRYPTLISPVRRANR